MGDGFAKGGMGREEWTHGMSWDDQRFSVLYVSFSASVKKSEPLGMYATAFIEDLRGGPKEARLGAGWRRPAVVMSRCCLDSIMFAHN